jgi:intein/homing endonuclease
MNTKEKAIFLAGLFTGRGCFAVNKSHKGYLSFRIKFGSKSEEFIRQITELLNDFKIPIMRDKHNQIWILSYKGMRKFTRIVKPHLKFKLKEVECFDTALAEYDKHLTLRWKTRNEGKKFSIVEAQPELNRIADLVSTRRKKE